MSFQTVNPANGEIIEGYNFLTESEIEQALAKSFKSWHPYSHLPLKIRQSFVFEIAKSLRAHKDELAFSMAREMGKPVTDGLAEVEKCAVTCEYLAEHAVEIFKTDIVQAQYKNTRIFKESLGPVLMIMPWNFPLWQVIRCAAPALLVGNPLLLKHAEIVAGTSALLTRLIQEKAPTPDVFLELRINHEQAAGVISDGRVRGVSFTGSAHGGAKVAAVAGAAVKKVVLELGGSDAYVTLEEADLPKAAKLCVQARMVNNGQSCVAAKRFFVHHNSFEMFVNLYQKEMAAFKQGDPLKPETVRGPLAALRFKDQLQAQCKEFERTGAKLLWQGDDTIKTGAYVPLQIYQCDLDNEWLRHEEIFGPIAVIMPYSDEREMLRAVNASDFGLGAAVFSQNIPHAERIAHDLDAGMVIINDQLRSDVRSPFGGVKKSGHGRELGTYGALEFANIKTIGLN